MPDMRDVKVTATVIDDGERIRLNFEGEHEAIKAIWHWMTPGLMTVYGSGILTVTIPMDGWWSDRFTLTEKEL